MKEYNEKIECTGRREFLVKAAFLAGGTLLTLSGAASAFGQPSEDLTIPIDVKSPLNKVGGSVTVESAAGKIVILRTGDTTFVAVSAVCTHKGGPLTYDAASKLFVCDWHDSKFDLEGKNSGGPAKKPVRAFTTIGSTTSVTIAVS